MASIKYSYALIFPKNLIKFNFQKSGVITNKHWMCQQNYNSLWMQNIGMEWFFRLCLEPRRLFKRYLYTNTYFIFLLAKTVIQKKYRDAGVRTAKSRDAIPRV